MSYGPQGPGPRGPGPGYHSSEGAYCRPRNKDPYELTLTPGANIEAAAAKVAKYIVNRWMPNNAGGIHMLVTPKIAAVLLELYKSVNATKISIKVRVTIENNIPVLSTV